MARRHAGIKMHMYSIVLGRLIRSRDRINKHAALCAGWPLITDLLTSCTRPRVNYSSSSAAHPKNSSLGPENLSSRGGLINIPRNDDAVSFTIVGNGESTFLRRDAPETTRYFPFPTSELWNDTVGQFFSEILSIWNIKEIPRVCIFFSTTDFIVQGWKNQA